MDCLAASIPILFIILSLVALFDKDQAWKWQENSNKTRGVISERTKEWERSITLISIVVIIINIIILIGIFQNSWNV